MSDPWADVREQVEDVGRGGSECKAPEACPGCTYDLLVDADALLAVVRDLAQWEYSGTLRDETKMWEDFAALPEHLRETNGR